MTLAIKDYIAVRGAPMALGSGLPGFVPHHDATVVARVRASGGRVVAKAQCEAFLLGANSFSSRPEPVRNPYDLARSAGGSSSGPAALVAAGRVDLAIGSDSGGSIRIPAAFCGVVGLKPTRGRVPCTGMPSIEPTLEHVGPIGRTVTDVSRLFAVLDGPDGTDPRQAWARRDTTAVQVPTESLRLGVFEPGFALADAKVADCVMAALERLDGSDARRTVVHWSAFEEALELHAAVYVAGRAFAAEPAGSSAFAITDPDGWAAWRAGLAEGDLPPELQMEIAAGRALLSRDPGLYGRALRRADTLTATLDALFDGVDVLALPTSPGLPPELPQGEVAAEALYGDTRLTAAFNLTGHPALSLPAGLVDGLPVGLQLVGRRGADQAVLAAASATERVLGQLPPPSGNFGERF